MRYEADWEIETCDSKEIVVNGASTAWLVRYRRRHQTETNWRAGKYRRSEFEVPAAGWRPTIMTGLHGKLVLLNSPSDGLGGPALVFDTESGQATQVENEGKRLVWLGGAGS